MGKKILNITNGDAFNRHFISNFGGEAIPFREAMMDGDSVIDIFSDEFINLRSAVHNVSTEKYRANMLLCDVLQSDNYTELRLWFGKDTFCQINLLTLLAYLEQIEYNGRVMLNYIDDETFEVIESDIHIELGLYKEIHKEVVILKQMPGRVGILSPQAFEMYFDYHSENGALSKIVRENLDREEMDVILLLLEHSKEYGLSDIQARKLIERNKKHD